MKPFMHAGNTCWVMEAILQQRDFHCCPKMWRHSASGSTKWFLPALTDRLLIPEITIDAEIIFPEIKYSFYNIVTQMEPFGPENMRPVFIARNVTDTGYSKICKGAACKICCKATKRCATGIGFNMAHKFHLVQLKKPLDIVFTIDENEWNGETDTSIKSHRYKAVPIIFLLIHISLITSCRQLPGHPDSFYHFIQIRARIQLHTILFLPGF